MLGGIICVLIVLFIIRAISYMKEGFIWASMNPGRDFNQEQDAELYRVDIYKLSPYEFEEYVAQRLRRKGFSNVRTTPKSGDYGADILAIAPNGKTVCVQCKRHTRPIGVKAVQEVLSAKAFYGCELACVIATNSFTPQAETMAKKTGVKLFLFKNM